MSSHERTTLVNMLRKLVLSNPANHAHSSMDALTRISSTKFCEPVEVILNIDELVEVLEDIGQVRLRVAPSVYEKASSVRARMYVRAAHSLCELIDLFASASGLDWKIGEGDAIEIYRRVSSEPQIYRLPNPGMKAQGGNIDRICMAH